MTAKGNGNFDKVLRCLEEIGLLLVSGNEIPDVRRLITGKSSRGSWWADKAAHEIFAINELLEDHADVTVTKLISGKVTFVHRQLWQKLFSIATAREEWQMRGLSVPAQLMLKEIDERGTLLTHKLSASFGAKPGETARELELRLLIHSEQVHTESGSHAKLIESWESWAERVKFKPRALDVISARHFLEKRLDEINKQHSGNGRLPWPLKTS
jgi:hypothetical protein